MTSENNLEGFKYPIGKYSFSLDINESIIEEWISEIEALPVKLREAVNGLTEEQLNTPYRPGGWTVKQVVHHIGDSHMNSISRFKWTLTEDRPVIKPYDEHKWAETKDYENYSVGDSLDFINALHTKFVVLLRSLNKDDLEKEFIHPEGDRTIKLKQNIGLYAWHGKHHTAHITMLRLRNNW